MKNMSVIMSKFKGLYKIVFCACAIFLGVFTMIITSTNETEKVSVGNDVSKASETFLNEDKITNETKPQSEAEQVTKNIYTDQERKEEVNSIEELKTPDMSFTPPVDGEIIKEYSPNELVYSKTMDDWRIHTGIDIQADVGSDIFAAQAGVVSFIGYDINMGYIVRITNGEFECSYMSLSSQIPVNEGEAVTKGQHIGTVSDSGVQELCDGGHLHFEIKKDGQIVNPSEYIYH